MVVPVAVVPVAGGVAAVVPVVVAGGVAAVVPVVVVLVSSGLLHPVMNRANIPTIIARVIAFFIN